MIAPGARCMIAAKALIGMRPRASGSCPARRCRRYRPARSRWRHRCRWSSGRRRGIRPRCLPPRNSRVDGGEMAAELDRLDPAQLVHDAFDVLRVERARADGHVAEAERAGAGHEAAAVEVKGRGGGSNEAWTWSWEVLSNARFRSGDSMGKATEAVSESSQAARQPAPHGPNACRNFAQRAAIGANF
jgi:hypothetical protein